MKNIKKIIFNILLTVLFQRKVYHYPFVQSCFKLQLIININDKFILINKNQPQLPSIEVDLANKHAIISSVKDFLTENISKKISQNSFLDLYLIDFFREVISTEQENRLFVDNLYLKLNLTDICDEESLLENTILTNLEEVKLLQFKNKFNIFDYKMLIKSQKEQGISIK